LVTVAWARPPWSRHCSAHLERGCRWGRAQAQPTTVHACGAERDSHCSCAHTLEQRSCTIVHTAEHKAARAAGGRQRVRRCSSCSCNTTDRSYACSSALLESCSTGWGTAGTAWLLTHPAHNTAWRSTTVPPATCCPGHAVDFMFVLVQVHDGTYTPADQFLKDPDSLCSTVTWKDEEDRVIWVYRIQVWHGVTSRYCCCC
jgi:hypothetical protein